MEMLLVFAANLLAQFSQQDNGFVQSVGSNQDGSVNLYNLNKHPPQKGLFSPLSTNFFNSEQSTDRR